jgi:hypothetical protein
MIIHKELKEELPSTIVEVQKQKSIEGFHKVVELVASMHALYSVVPVQSYA